MNNLALQGQAVGDAFGACFEYAPGFQPLVQQILTQQHYLTWEESGQKPNRARLAGCYTDDTQQALALLYSRRMTLDPFLVYQMMAESKISDAEFGSHRGTGRNFRDCVTSGAPVPTAGLGAAMRVGPVATTFDDPARMLEWVLLASEKTTTDPVGLASAGRFATVAWALSHPTKKHLISGLQPSNPELHKAWADLGLAIITLKQHGINALMEFARSTGYSNRVLEHPADGFGLTGVAWVIVEALGATSFTDALQRVTALGGDTDTVGAMAGCLAAMRHPIPTWMIDSLMAPCRDIVLNPHNWEPWMEVPITRMEIQLRQTAKATRAKISWLDLEAELPDPPVLFGGPGDSWAEFSNFHRAPFVLDGHTWPTVEHYFQAMKRGDDPAFVAKVLRDPSPAGAKRLGRHCTMREDWDSVKEEYMLKGCLAKFTQNPHLATSLLATNDRLLHENRPDAYWGGGPHYPGGKDRLGYVLCMVRDHLRGQA